MSSVHEFDPQKVLDNAAGKPFLSSKEVISSAMTTLNLISMRVEEPGMMFTMEYRENRLRVILGEQK